MMKFLRMMTGNSDDPRYSEEKLLLRATIVQFNVGGIERGHFQDDAEKKQKVKLVSVTPDAEQTMAYILLIQTIKTMISLLDY